MKIQREIQRGERAMRTREKREERDKRRRELERQTERERREIESRAREIARDMLAETEREREIQSYPHSLYSTQSLERREREGGGEVLVLLPAINHSCQVLHQTFKCTQIGHVSRRRSLMLPSLTTRVSWASVHTTPKPGRRISIDQETNKLGISI